MGILTAVAYSNAPMKTIFRIVVLFGGLVFWGGCASPETRIRKNPALFHRGTLQQQEMIRQGRVGIDFDQEMVRLALGEPSRVVERSDAQGKTEIWNYSSYEGHDELQLHGGTYHRYWGDPLYPHFLSYPSHSTEPHIIVIFRDGNVAAIEQRK